MTATTMDGRALAAEVKERLRQEVDRMKLAGLEPTLATVLVGDNPASKMYLDTKHKAAREVGISSANHALAANATSAELAALVSELNSRDDVHGILVQLPLPEHLNPAEALAMISPDKDVDGLTPANMNRLFYRETSLVPCTAKGIMALLHRYEIPISGAHVVIINRSILIGRPLYQLLLAEDATVTMCHSKTRDLTRISCIADIIITAVGRRPYFSLTADMVKEGAVVVDAAINRVDGRVVGDADPEVSEKASHITPVPGGVGPMTVTMLLENTILAARNLAQPRRQVEVVH